MTDRQIFGYTPPTPSEGQVGYVAAHYVPDHSNHWPADRVRLTVRPGSLEPEHPVSIDLPRDYALDLADMIVANAHPQLPLKDDLAQFFAWDHLPQYLQPVSRMFGVLAQRIMMLPKNPERTAAIRHLLEAKDCAVRAVLWKSGDTHD